MEEEEGLPSYQEGEVDLPSCLVGEEVHRPSCLEVEVVVRHLLVEGAGVPLLLKEERVEGGERRLGVSQPPPHHLRCDSECPR